MNNVEKLIPRVIAAYKSNRTVENVLGVLDILGVSKVWIPGTAVTGQSDQEQREGLLEWAEGDPETLIGEKFTSKEEVRFIPDILESKEGNFFPVFSSCEEMGEYGARFSKIEKPFTEAVEMSKHSEKELVGIVVNAFTDAMIFPWEALKFVSIESDGE